MTTETFVLRAKLARRMPDPNFSKVSGLEHHIFLVNCRDLPKDLPMEANARRPNTRKQVYREVQESLTERRGEPGSFHLKNKGIVIVAESVTQIGRSNDQYAINLNRTSQGVLDGGHTYKLIIDAQKNGELPEDQFVFVQVRIGVPEEWIAEISEGLNTSVQVQDMSLQHLAGRFEWIKDELKGQPYLKKIAWSENDPGDYTARDLMAIMYLFTVQGSDQHPIAGYEKKSEALKAYEKNEASFIALRLVLKDILFLHDWIALTATDFYNNGARQLGLKARGGALSFVQRAKRKPYKASFFASDRDYDDRLEDAALYPILAAFRVFLVKDKVTAKFHWHGGFESVKSAWEEMAYELVRATYNTAETVGRSVNAIGKSRLHWDVIYQKVENYKLRQLSRTVQE